MKDLAKKTIIRAIDLYQHSLSPDHGWLKDHHPYGFCRHHPSCSEYTKQAIIRFGVFQGLWLGFKRILRCNPWSEPSVDPLDSISN